ncbi:hypothetical protein OQA88_430 [Cercophora sp. LCS_1]
MAQAPNAEESRERAVSSEPSTRPNPFDDGDISSRKRQRTSLSGASRSRSVETVNSSQGSPAVGESAPEPRNESAMKIDTDLCTPTTPEPQQPATQPPSGQRSSRVTINVRTPSRPLEAIPSSPSSPLTKDTLPAVSGSTEDANIPTDGVQISVEESELEMSREETLIDTPVSSTSNGSSPPVELVSMPLDNDNDDADFISDDPEVTILGSFPRGTMQDPTGDFPFHDNGFTYQQTINNKLPEYFFHHEQVSRNISEWMESYLQYVKTAPYSAIMRTQQDFRDLWLSLPDLITGMVKRKSYPQNLMVRDSIFGFYRSFARLTAFFVELDLKALRAATELTPPRFPELISHNYLQAIGVLTSKDQVTLQVHQLGGGPGWSYSDEMTEVLDTFQSYNTNQGGSFAYLDTITRFESELIGRFPKLIDHLAPLSMVVASLVSRALRGNLVDEHVTRSYLVRGYSVFKVMSTALTSVVEKNVNHLSHETAAELINSLTSIYQISLIADEVVPVEITRDFRQRQPAVAPYNVSEAIAYQWKFTAYNKLIMSSQMQLRVMAVTSMCSDLVGIYQRFRDGSERSTAYLNYMVEFLLHTGLVLYILGPTCHPEITTESSNIIGFLVVSSTYTSTHTDAMWETVTTTQDPRVSDALIKMAGRIAGLYSLETLTYFCRKMDTVPVEAFGPTMREFCGQVLTHLSPKMVLDRVHFDSAPYDLCIRLIRQSSGLGKQTPVAHADIQQFALLKLKELLSTCGPTPECRQQIYLDCIHHIAQRTPGTIGSLWVLFHVIRTGNAQQEMHVLTSQHDLTRLLVDELEAAISEAQHAGFSAVLSGPQNAPRKDLLTCIILHEPATIDAELGPRLWRLLVGVGAASIEDRDVAWQLLNNTWKRSKTEICENQFVATCFSEYLPTLEPECFCLGAIEFVREGVLPLVNDEKSILLDDEQSPDHAGLEQLWRMVLTAPEGTIEQQAIHTLVNDVYVNSRSVLAFSHYRAKKVHLALVNRCFQQLSSAVTGIKGASDGPAAGDEDPMVVIVTDQQRREHETLFIRSLSVLRQFHRLHQAKRHFSAPDLRYLISECPSEVAGDLAELKYQSFDGSMQTDVKPLVIGKKNTAASLLASLREATGFGNYQMFYKGRPFIPNHSDICKSLEDLKIDTGIILVKRESDVSVSLTQTRAPATPVEVEILSHFDEMWSYLSMEERLAQEIFPFLVKLPAHESLLEAIESPSTTYPNLFPPGQPFKSLYAIHVMREVLATQRQSQSIDQLEEYLNSDKTVPCAYSESLNRAMALVVPAVLDKRVIGLNSDKKWEMELGSSLVECFVSLLKDLYLPASAAQLLDGSLLDRLLTILTAGISVDTSQSEDRYIPLFLESILESCSRSVPFMNAFCTHAEIPRLLENMLLYDKRELVRGKTARLVLDKIGENTIYQSASTDQFRAFFWPLVSGLVGSAIANPSNSAEVMTLCLAMFNTLRTGQTEILDLKKHMNEWAMLLLDYETSEDLTQPEMVDHVGASLIRLVYAIVCGQDLVSCGEFAPPSSTAQKLFRAHLFPSLNGSFNDSRPVLSSESRSMLNQIVLSLVEADPLQHKQLLLELYDLVPPPEYEDPQSSSAQYWYHELPAQFERTKAVRAPCGYVGLKNLSNTCYFNSLITQLFMNVDFRRFMLDVELRDRDRAYNQNLLLQTQKMFGNMQETINRFVNPEDCVGAIKTYENEQIDIGLQMDVDEFYNLLFDRWEGQLSTAEEKRQFRSFYGGQLVQQVSSKECDHVSERLEPFSAIQCDIKGKNTLQESLQAYVDGEIMAGENKYKCSKCDCFVDAVKRTCLKDIPDNLIFHLKRFEFNLRTLQRSKINDHFTFPTEIDMRPYTFDHLSNENDKSEDVFELVGILVHSGTAETGHYYSYIRERPSSSEDPVWLEFNDDIVTSWDPAMMESSCFGGSDFRSHFDNSGANDGKTYSAYMLFYQRSTSLAKGQELLRRSGCASPLRVRLISELDQYIQADNLCLLRRHCLYDPHHIRFVSDVLLQARSLGKSGCDEDHDIETLAITTGLGHLDQVASRAKDVPDFYTLLGRIGGMCESCVHCSLSAIKYLCQHPEVVRMMVQRNPEQEVRRNVASLILQILEVIKEQAPDNYSIAPVDMYEDSDAEDLEDQGSVVVEMMDIFKSLWAHCHTQIRSWPEVFDFMLAFVKMGRREMTAYLDRNFLRYLLWMVSADPNGIDLPPNFVRMINLVLRRMATRPPPSYEAAIGLLEALVTNMQIMYDENGDVSGVDDDQDRTIRRSSARPQYWFTYNEARILHTEWGRNQGTIFVDKLISINQNNSAIDSILGHLVKQSEVMEAKVFRTLRCVINGQNTQHNLVPYLRVASKVFCRFARSGELIVSLLRHISEQCLGLQCQEGEMFLDFHREVFDGPQENSGMSSSAIIMVGYDNLPMWATGLLNYPSSAVVHGTEHFLNEVLFKFGPAPTFEDTEEGRARGKKIVDTAKLLGINCLRFLRDNYVVDRENVSSRLVVGPERVIKECNRFVAFSPQDELSREFVRLSNVVLEPLRRLIVEELEEDGSEWENSSGCSEPMENFGDVSGDLPDSDL